MPKPDVVDSKNKLSMERILKFKKRVKSWKSSSKLSNTIKSMVENNDPINKRILECLDPKMMKKTTEFENEGNILNFIKIYT